MGSQWGGGFHVDRASGEVGANLCFHTTITVTKTCNSSHLLYFHLATWETIRAGEDS
jgi:hypothetical protein